jgi:hypothetical protein
MPFHPNPTLISDKELVGRRIFGDKIWDGDHSKEGMWIFRWDHFFDERLVEINDPNDGLSFDRLGVRRPDKDVLAILRPLAEKEGSDRVPSRQFKGWAVVAVAKLRHQIPSCELRPQRIVKTSSEGNIYHAVLNIPCYQT